MTLKRELTCLQIHLTKKQPKDIKIAGYQEPIPESEVNADAGPDEEERAKQRRKRNKSKKGGKEGEDDEEEEKKEQP